MAIQDALDRYFDGWNHGDGAAVVSSLTAGGTYEDPTTGGPLTGDALAASVSAVATGFPDLSFDVVSVATTSDTSVVVQWVMHGTNTGPMPGGPATGGTIALPGVDLIEYDPGADRIAKVVGYFDSATMLHQLGLQAHVTPNDMDGITFGYGLRIDSGREAVPGAFTITWIEIDEEHHDHLRDSTMAIVGEGRIGRWRARSRDARRPQRRLRRERARRHQLLGTRADERGLPHRPREVVRSLRARRSVALTGTRS